MAKVVVIGVGGYAGSHIAEAAVQRDFDVVGFSRNEVAMQLAGVRYQQGSILSPEDRMRMLEGSAAVVVAVSARGNMLGQTRPAIAELAREANDRGVRLVVIGGAGSLHISEGGPLVIESGFPEEFKPEALEMRSVLEDLRSSQPSLDWAYVSPAGGFGPENRGEYRGEYRVGGEVLLTDDDGVSDISGADFGVAIADELEEPVHHRAQFTVAY